MRIIIDENVSYDLVVKLRGSGDEIISVSELQKSVSDEYVYKLALQHRAILVTRDYHFSNPLRFPAERTEGIIYIRHGNLKSEEETALVDSFLRGNNAEVCKGKLITLYREGFRIR
ncbi:MAG: DUF5615 family PIN-like protein [Dehalococcoidia bacterium]|nr:DUF5615 family PIN-like protein [Dehalococcoidia bacterium]